MSGHISLSMYVFSGRAAAVGFTVYTSGVYLTTITKSKKATVRLYAGVQGGDVDDDEDE